MTETDAADVPMSEPASTAVVTGASGWLGQNLVRALVGRRERIRCLVPTDDERRGLALLSTAVEVVVGDVRDPATADRLFEGVGRAPPCSTPPRSSTPRRRSASSSTSTSAARRTCVDRARRAGAARFVHVSSNSPFGVNPTPDDVFTEDSPYDPYLGYGKSK